MKDHHNIDDDPSEDDDVEEDYAGDVSIYLLH